jgi:hypothetical protein
MAENVPKTVQDLEIRVVRTDSGLKHDDGATEIAPAANVTAASSVRSSELTYRVESPYADGRQFALELGPLPVRSLDSAANATSYGRQLFAWLFPNQFLRWLRESVLGTAEHPGAGMFGSDGSHIRLRLTFEPRASELINIRWETLCEPDPSCPPVAIQTAFSRFLRLRGPRAWPITDRPLRMLNVISNPSGLGEFELNRFDERFHKQVLASATRPLGTLVDLGNPVYNPTPNELQRAMERPQGRDFHIVNLVAHSVMEQDRAYLLLANDQGSAEKIPIEVIRDAMKSITPPYLVFLATPLTGGSADGAGLLRSAPMLLATGVQAVVVIPSAMPPDPLQIFTERFYEVLLRTGAIDRAVAEARRTLFESAPSGSEWSVPVLYMRTPDARLFLQLSDAVESSLSTISFGE